jgi:anthranilate synthase component 2
VVQYLGELGAEVVVHRNDEITLAQIEKLQPEKIVISPGPCTPFEAGISMDVVRTFAGQIPLLGICLGHQSIGCVFGGQVVRAAAVMHGKVSAIYHSGAGVFRGLSQPFEATRYHSLIVDRDTLPDCLEVTAWAAPIDAVESSDEIEQIGDIMGIKHRTLPIEGVQFHPESILTLEGQSLLHNFLTGH